MALWETLGAAVPYFMLASLRVGVTFACMPAPFGSIAPATVRLAVSLVVTFALSLAMFDPTTPLAVDAVSLLRAAVCELFLGAVIGMTVRVILAASEIAGSAIGQSIGLGFATTVDPSHGDSVLPTTLLLGGMIR